MPNLHASLFPSAKLPRLAPFAAAIALAAALPSPASVRLVSPADGQTVPLLSEGHKARLDAPRAERVAKFADKKERAQMRKLGYVPLKVALEWEWSPDDAEGPAAKARPRFVVEVRRLPEGVPVFRADCVEPRAELDNLRIATEYEWTVRADILGRVEPPVSGRFRTEDHAPRLVNLHEVPNVRDLGGRIGRDGRRVRQGLVYRSAGLNENASTSYFTREETLARASDPAALLAKEAALKAEKASFEELQRTPGAIKFANLALSRDWTVFRPQLSDDAFLAEGLPAALALREVPEKFLGAVAETATLDANGFFEFPAEVHKAAIGPAVFVQVAEADSDGWVSLGCGADWWWSLSVNGRIVFDRSSIDKGNGKNPISATNHTFLVPVRKGANVFAASVRCGSAGWRWCCRTAPAVPIAELLANSVENAQARIDALFREPKGMQKGRSRINDGNRDLALKALGIRSDIDLRGAGECWGMEGSPLGPTVTWWHYSSGSYSQMTNNFGRGAFTHVFRVFLDPANYPIDFHCIAGQDRTGAVAFILNALLGVDEEELWRDWEATGFWNPNPDFNHVRLFNKLVSAFDGFPGDTINERVEAYVLSLGFTADDIEAFRAIMLE